MDNTDTDLPGLNAALAEVRADLAELRADVKDLLDAWNTATGMEWLSTFATALAVLYAAVKGPSARDFRGLFCGETTWKN